MRRLTILCLVLAVGLMWPATAYAGKADHRSPAAAIEMVKKVEGLVLPPSWGPGSPRGFPATTGVLGSPLPQGGVRYAILIGVADYAGEDNDLQYSDDDALVMRDVLVGRYGFSPDNIRLLIDGDATRNAILEAIAEIGGGVTPDDEVVFFYSGHGARGIANDGDREAIDEGIVPQEYLPQAVIWDGELRDRFSGFETGFPISVQGGDVTRLIAPLRAYDKPLFPWLSSPTHPAIGLNWLHRLSRHPTNWPPPGLSQSPTC